MDSHSTYDYKRIGKKQLRLCKFHISGPEISAELKIVPFEDKPPEKYFALSYSWEENPSKEIYNLATDQKSLKISASLKDFVDGLRSKSRSDSLDYCWWIDSICINQDDSVEKTKQVQRMRDIYQHAHEVVVWLGKESGSSARAREFIEELNTRKDRPPKMLREEKYRQNWEDLQNFFDRAWWTRVWTVQECSIPSNLNYWCGSHTIRKKSIFKTLETAYDADPPDFNGSSAFNHAWNRRRAWQVHDRIRASKDKSKRVLSLPALAAYFCDTEATYDRDRLYGFAALATESFLFEPDFNSSTDDVYLRFTRSFIDYYKSLSIIIFASIFNATPGSLLPSWVPDWRTRRRPFPAPLMITQSASTSIGNLRPSRYHDVECKYSASGDAKAKYGFDITKLLAWGCVVNEVDEIAGSHNGDRTQNPHGQPPSSAAVYHTKDTLMGICRCLTLNRKDRYLRFPMPTEWFQTDFVQLCLYLNHGFSLPNPPRRYAYHSDSDSEDSSKTHGSGGADKSTLASSAAHQSSSDPTQAIPDDFKQWFKSTQSLHIRGTTFGTMLRTFESNSNATLNNPLPRQREHHHSSFYGRFCDVTKTMGMRLMTTCEPRKGMASPSVQYKTRVGMAPPGALKGDLICILFGCSVPVVLRKLERSDEYVLIGECFLDECMNGEAIKGWDLDTQAREFRIV